MPGNVSQSLDIQLCQTGKDWSKLLQPLPVIGCCCVSTGSVFPFHGSEGHLTLISKLARASRKKDFPRGWEEGIRPGGSYSRFDFLVSHSKNWCISICWQGYQCFLSWVRVFDPHGFLFPIFFSTEEEDQGNWKGFAWLGTVGVLGWLFLPGYVNGEMPLLREALKSSSVPAGTEFGSDLHQLAWLCFEMLMWDNCIFPSLTSCSSSFKYFSWSGMINI